MYRLIIAFLVVTLFSSFLWVESSHGLTLNDLEPSSYQEKFSHFKNSYLKVPQSEILSIEENKRPTADDLEKIQSIIINLQNTCTTISSKPSSSGVNGSLVKLLSKFKIIESINESTTALEQEVGIFLSRCFEENNYTKTLERLSILIEQTNSDPQVQPLFNNNALCTPVATRLLIRNKEKQTKDYNLLRGYTDSSVNSYNEKNSRYNELESNIKSLGESNEKLGEDSKGIIQRLTFLNTRVKSEQQELALLYSDLEDDYDTLSQQPSIPKKDLNNLLSADSTKIAFSLDQENSWFVFDKHTDLISFLRLLKASNEEVGIIQQRAIAISQKKQSISELFAERLANTMVLDLIAKQIEDNTTQIAKFNSEQEVIGKTLSGYREIAEKRRAEDRHLRAELAKFDTLAQACINKIIDDFTKSTVGLEELNPDIRIEFDRQYIERFSKNELDESRNVTSLVNKDPEKVAKIAENFRNTLPMFTNCKEGVQLRINTNTVNIEPGEISGVRALRIYDASNTEPVNVLEGIVEKYVSSTSDINYENIDLFMKFLENEIKGNSTLRNSVANISEFAVTPEKWTQELNTIEHTFKTYRCEQSQWEEVSSEKELSLEVGECKNEKSETLNLTLEESNKEIEQALIKSLKTTLNVNVYGSCQEEPLN